MLKSKVDPCMGWEIFWIQISNITIIVRDDVNIMHHPSDWEVKWRALVLGETSSVQKKDSTIETKLLIKDRSCKTGSPPCG